MILDVYVSSSLYDGLISREGHLGTTPVLIATIERVAADPELIREVRHTATDQEIWSVEVPAYVRGQLNALQERFGVSCREILSRCAFVACGGGG